jgi:hypothetical protein
MLLTIAFLLDYIFMKSYIHLELFLSQGLPLKTLVVAVILLVSSVSHANNTVVYCDRGIQFVVPTTKGSRVNLQYELNAQVTTLEFNSLNLLLVATDQIEPTRIRLTISAVFIGITTEGNHIYKGQLMADFGDRQRQIISGPIECIAVDH